MNCCEMLEKVTEYITEEVKDLYGEAHDFAIDLLKLIEDLKMGGS